MDLIFIDACNHAHYILYNHAYFAGSIFKVRQLSMRTGPFLKISHYMVYDHGHSTSYIVHSYGAVGAHNTWRDRHLEY